MTDKQMIIDGVDVSGCEHFSVHSSNGCCAYFLENEDTIVDCKNYPNCYYKRMMHTGAELNIHKNDKEHAYKRIAELQKENEELKNFHINLVGVKECEIKELVKLKQTLTEIKPILEFYANSKVGEEQPDGTYKIELAGISMRGYGTDFLIFNPKPAKQVLQKIREILDEN